MIGTLALAAAAAYLLGGKSEEDQVPVENPFSPAIWTRWDALFKKYGAQYGVPWTWLKAFCLKESTLGTHPKVARGLASPSDIEGSKSEDGKSWGPMQFTLPTARDFDPSATPEKLNGAEYSIKLAAQFVKSLMGQFAATDPRRLEWIVKSYNQGAGNTRKEMRGETAGYTGNYWPKWSEFHRMVEANQ